MGLFSMTSPSRRYHKRRARSGLGWRPLRFRYRLFPSELRNNHPMAGSLAVVVLGMVNVSLLPLVVFGTVAVGVVMSIVFLISSENVYDQIGQGGMTRDSEAPPEDAPAPAAPPLSSAAGRAEQEREVRQMLGARSARMVARGEQALDIDAEVAKLLAPADAAAAGGHDAELEAEVRELVLAKNERRVRRGLEPLDVAAEVKRTLQELG
jgi:hypothetical protein